MRKLLVVSIEVDETELPVKPDLSNLASLLCGIDDGAVDGRIVLSTISDIVDSPPAPIVPDEPDMAALSGFSIHAVREVKTAGELAAVMSQFPAATVLRAHCLGSPHTVVYDGGELTVGYDD